jgi:hypothetical protein
LSMMQHSMALTYVSSGLRYEFEFMLRSSGVAAVQLGLALRQPARPVAA